MTYQFRAMFIPWKHEWVARGERFDADGRLLSRGTATDGAACVVSGRGATEAQAIVIARGRVA